MKAFVVALLFVAPAAFAGKTLSHAGTHHVDAGAYLNSCAQFEGSSFDACALQAIELLRAQKAQQATPAPDQQPFVPPGNMGQAIDAFGSH